MGIREQLTFVKQRIEGGDGRADGSDDRAARGAGGLLVDGNAVLSAEPAPAAKRAAADLGEILVNEGLITRGQLLFCIRKIGNLTQQGQRAMLRDELVYSGFITPAALSEVLRRHGFEHDVVDDAASLQRILPPQLRAKLGIQIQRLEGSRLDVAARRILSEADKGLIIQAAAAAGFEIDEVRPVAMDRRELHAILDRQSSIRDQSLESEICAVTEESRGATVNGLLAAILIEALEDGASDIYFSVNEDPRQSMVRRRIDGSVRLRMLVMPDIMRRITAVLKDRAGIDIGDTRRPHDARMSFDYQNRTVDVRVSTLPAASGEEITLRLLDPGTIRGLSSVWSRFPEIGRRCEHFAQNAGKFAAMFLLTGATGAGKTTTLRAMALAMPRERIKVMSSEDPIEFILPHVVQTQVDEAAGLGFADILRTQLRQDLDVAIVGEIRDRPTLQAVLRTCESGANVLSTVHADDAPQSIQRAMALLDQNEKESAGYIVGRYLHGIVNQQLAPMLCGGCKIERRVDEIRPDWADAMQHCGLADSDVVHEANPEGCLSCGHTGYQGRTLVPDALFVPDTGRGVFTSAIISGDYQALYDMPEIARYSRESALLKLLREGVYDLRAFGAHLERKDIDAFH